MIKRYKALLLPNDSWRVSTIYQHKKENHVYLNILINIRTVYEFYINSITTPLMGGEGQNVTVHFNVCKTSRLAN